MNKTILKHIIRYILMILILLLCIKIFKLSGESGLDSENKSHRVTKIVVSILYKDLNQEQVAEKIGLIDPTVRKVTHFMIYGLLGILLMSCMATFKNELKKKFIISMVYSFLYACSDEIHQHFVPGRSGEIRDVLIDSSGALLGILVCVAIIVIAKRIADKKEAKVKKLTESNKIEKRKRKIIFIASTGGHLNELMQLKPIFNDYDYHIITERTEVDKSFKEEYKDKMRFLIYGTKKYPIRYFFKFAANCLISLYYYFKFCPDTIITTGTHTAVPMCYIGKLFGSKVIFIETFANRTTKTLAGRIVYPIADVFVVQWEEMHELYPKSVCWGWIY